MSGVFSKMKKRLLLIASFIPFCLSSCSETKSMPVIFYDYDGTVLQVGGYSKENGFEYHGEAPQRESDEMYDYTFKGWNESLSQDSTHRSFYAQYEKTLRQFKVTYKDYYGYTFSERTVSYGENATLPVVTPTRTVSDTYVSYDDMDVAEDYMINDVDYKIRHVFAGYEGEGITYVTSDVTCKAVYNKVLLYRISYYDDYDSSYPCHEEYIEEGSSSTYKISTTREVDDSHIYVFDKWDKPVSLVSSPMRVTATYKLVNVYTVTFLNYDGSTLMTTKVMEGETANYNGSTPYRPSTTSGDYRYDYTFSGWSGSLTNIYSDITVTAQFSTSYTYIGDPTSTVKQHLNNYGTGTYHSVSTGTGSTLGYKGSYFYCSYQNSDSLSSTFAANYYPGDNYLISTFEIKDGSTTTYSASQYIYISNHVVSNMTVGTIEICRYTTDSQLELVAALSMLAAQYAVNRASQYLENHGLPYIW